MRGDCLRTCIQAALWEGPLSLMKRGMGPCEWEEQAGHALLSLLTPHSHEPRSHTKHPTTPLSPASSSCSQAGLTEEVSSVMCLWWREQVRRELCMLQDNCQSTASKTPGQRQGWTLGQPSSLRNREGLGKLLSSILIDPVPTTAHCTLAWTETCGKGKLRPQLGKKMSRVDLLPRHICDWTLPSPSQILQLFVPYEATPGCLGYLNWNSYAFKTQCPPLCWAAACGTK